MTTTDDLTEVDFGPSEDDPPPTDPATPQASEGPRNAPLAVPERRVA